MTSNDDQCLLFQQSQLNSLPPLSVPKRLIHKWRGEGRGGEGRRQEEEEGGEIANQTDQEKSVVKETATLLEVQIIIIRMSTRELHKA